MTYLRIVNKFMIQIVNMKRSRENAPLQGANFRAARSAVRVGNSVHKFVCNSAFADPAMNMKTSKVVQVNAGGRFRTLGVCHSFAQCAYAVIRYMHQHNITELDWRVRLVNSRRWTYSRADFLFYAT